MSSQARFAGKVAMVTGGGMGVGAETARALAREGAAVAIVDLDEAAARSVVGEIEGAGGESLVAVADVGDSDSARRAVEATIARFGGLDLLVNNAGVVIYGELPDMAEEDWDAVLATNLKGQYLMSKYAIPEMRKRGGGAIVNLSSVQALVSQRTVAAYAASKGGVVAMTKTVAIDHAREGIRVNCVLPGSVRTPMLERAARMAPGDPEETIAAWGRVHPRGTVIEPSEVAAVVLFLLSDQASAVTGAAVVVDAGLSAQAAL